MKAFPYLIDEAGSFGLALPLYFSPRFWYKNARPRLGLRRDRADY